MSLLLSLRDPALRRFQLSRGLAGIAVAGWPTVLWVLIFQRDGAGAVGALLAVRDLWAALVTPWMGAWCDRARRERLLLFAHIVLALTILLVALSWWRNAPLSLFFVPVLLDGTVTALRRPARQGLLPWLAKTPRELTAANGLSELIGIVTLAIGPALGALGLALGDAEFVFVGYAIMTLGAAVAISSIWVEVQNPRAAPESSFWADSLAGARSAVLHPRLRFALGLLAAGATAGAIVVVLVNPLAIDLLGMGESGPPLLTATIGVGAGVGGIALSALERRFSLGFLLQGGVILLGLVAALAAATSSAWVVVFLFLVGGIGILCINVAGVSIVQRMALPEQLSRVSSAQTLLTLLGSALGAGLASPLMSLLGLRASLLALGCALIGIGVLAQARRSAVDRALEAQGHALDVLETDLFSPLSVAVRQGLASAIEVWHVRAGDVLIQEGDEGSRFYILEAGELEVSSQGRVLRYLKPPDFFGEIALVRRVRRTATVRAVTDARIWYIERDAFLSAVSGHHLSRERARQIVEERMAAGGSDGSIEEAPSPAVGGGV